MGKRSFTPELFSFLRELSENNSREWFNANRHRYVETVQEPALDFVGDFAARLREISPHFVADARPVGGSLFRIHRDVRFSKDKSPYKTNTGVHFRHELGKDAHAPGFYLHLAPGESFAGVGIWRPDSRTLTRIRNAIVDDPDRWSTVTRQSPFADVYRLGGDSLKRPPAGYDAEHPLIVDLRRKEFVGFAVLDEATVTSEGFLEEYAAICRAAKPFMGFLCDAVGVPF